MRVTHIAPTMFGASGLLGGGERYPLELARALATQVDCRLVTFGPRRGYHREGALEIVVLRRLLQLKGHPAHPVALDMARWLDADVLHTHQMRAAPSRLAALQARARRRPIVVTDHGLGGGGWAGLLPRLFDAFLVVSRFSAATLRADAGRTHVIYGGVDPRRFRPGNETRSGVLFVGRITPHKGIDRLIRALPPGVQLTVAGSRGHDPRPPESRYPMLIQRLAATKEVRVAGEIDEPELPRLYRSASVFALPSVHVTCYGRKLAISELLGLSVLEAMASGTPVVCSRIGGVAEIVAHGETGYLVEPGNEHELRERLEELVRDHKRARAMGENARELVLERFTWERCAQRCLQAYEQVLHNRAA